MAMRRPRIKASANLTGIKRKPKKVEDTKIEETDKITVEESVGIVEPKATTDHDQNSSVDNDIVDQSAPLPVDAVAELPTHTPAAEDENVQTLGYLEAAVQPREAVEMEHLTTDDVTVSDDHVILATMVRSKSELEDDSSFKCPLKVDFNRSNSCTAVSNLDDVFHSDLEENIIQMDLKSINGHPMSPSKAQARQRIRATPIFGQRRNSFVGSSPSPHTGGDDVAASMDFAVPASTTPRRERHYSASHSQTSNTSSSTHFHTPHKYPPTMGMGRIRTESGCSSFSDTYAASSKSRSKVDEHNHRTISRRDFEARFTNGVPDKSTLKMFDLIYYNPVTNPMEQKPILSNIKKETSAPNPDDPKATATTEDSKTGTEDTKKEASAIPVPQLKLNSNGELILDDKSLEIETTAEQEARKVLANSSVVFLDENTGMNGFYKRQKRTKEWPPEETIKFYRCLQTIGTDFSVMCQLFPQRTRRDLKLKFKKEERCNATLINKALLYPKKFNIEDLKTQLQTEEREREEAERKWKEIKAKEANKLKKTANVKTSVGARALKNGDDVYQNENIVKTKLSKRALKSDKSKKDKPSESINNNDDDNNDNLNNINIDEKPKRKRRRREKATASTISTAAPAAPPLSQKVKIEDVCIIMPPIIPAPVIKTETIKAEQNPLQTAYAVNECMENVNDVDTNQLENELTELLHADAILEEDDHPQQSTTYAETNAHDEEQYFHASDAIENVYNSTLVVNSALSSPAAVHTPPAHTAYNGDNGEEFPPQKTFVNLDDGSTVTLLTDTQEPQQIETFAALEEPRSVASSRDLDERDIQQILTELAEGSLVLVSTLDPENADKVLNEIYMLDSNTGELCDEPLDIPEAIVHAILSVMS